MTTTTYPRGAWVHLYADTLCGHGCRTVERHGAIVGRTADTVTIQLYDWDIIDGRVPRPILGAVLRLASDELAPLGAAVYANYADARLVEADAVARGLGNCGHHDIAPTRLRRPYEPTTAESVRDATLADLGAMSSRELSRHLLGLDCEQPDGGDAA